MSATGTYHPRGLVNLQRGLLAWGIAVSPVASLTLCFLWFRRGAGAPATSGSVRTPEIGVLSI